MKDFEELNKLLSNYIELLQIKTQYTFRCQGVLGGLDETIKLVELAINKCCSKIAIGVMK